MRTGHFTSGLGDSDGADIIADTDPSQLSRSSKRVLTLGVEPEHNRIGLC